MSFLVAWKAKFLTESFEEAFYSATNDYFSFLSFS